MTLATAISIATEAHAGQLDKYGAPYIAHVMRVMQLGKTDDERIVGVLHDVVEDTSWTFGQLIEKGTRPTISLRHYGVSPNSPMMKTMITSSTASSPIAWPAWSSSMILLITWTSEE